MNEQQASGNDLLFHITELKNDLRTGVSEIRSDVKELREDVRTLELKHAVLESKVQQTSSIKGRLALAIAGIGVIIAELGHNIWAVISGK